MKEKLLIGIFVFIFISLSIANLVIYLSNSKEIVVHANNNLTSDYWSEMIKEYPSYKQAYIEYGRELLKIGDVEGAMKMFENARLLDPNM